MNDKVTIRRLATGVPGLDELLGGGIPEFSFNLIAGTPGSGKTTLAHQMMFSLAKPDARALFFTVLGEPALKMLRYQQQFTFFDVAKLDKSVRYVNLSADLLEGNLERLMTRITDEVAKHAPSYVFVDSFRSVVRSARWEEQRASELENFVQQLGMQMTTWQATTFLMGEYLEPESESAPVFTVADGILWLGQALHRNSTVRKVQVVKMRGQAQVPGLHAFRIDNDGLRVFPRAIVQRSAATEVSVSGRVNMGVPALDEMLGGGLPAGYSLLLVGPSGSGKTVLATEFLAEGVRRGEAGVIAAFEKSPSQLLNNKLASLVASGQVGLVNTRALDLTIDETLHDLISVASRLKARRVVIDSLSGFELALSPEFSEDFRGSLYRMVAELTSRGMTVLLTSELEDRYTDLRFSPAGGAFLVDAIIAQRYVELDGQLKRALSVIKVRGSAHSKDIRLFEISDEDLVLGKSLSDYSGILSGQPRRRAP
jgi:circadian clock protein KaiC